MFDPHDTQAVMAFLAHNGQAEIHADGRTATGVHKLMAKVDERAQRRRDTKQLLRLRADQLADAGWTRHDVAASGVKWGKMLKQHGATSLVRTLGMTLQDATEMGMTASQLLGMTSDLLAEWKVMAPDMIALGATVPQLLDRYETSQNLGDMGFTRDIMVHMGMKPERADALFGTAASSSAASPQASDADIAAAPALVLPTNTLETLSLEASTSLDF